MSIRAYRVNVFEFNSNESFSLNDCKITDWLEQHTCLNESLSFFGNGLFELYVKDAEKMIEELKDKIEPELIDNIKKDIEHAKAKNQDYILYYCF